MLDRARGDSYRCRLINAIRHCRETGFQIHLVISSARWNQNIYRAGSLGIVVGMSVIDQPAMDPHIAPACVTAKIVLEYLKRIGRRW